MLERYCSAELSKIDRKTENVDFICIKPLWKEIPQRLNLFGLISINWFSSRECQLNKIIDQMNKMYSYHDNRYDYELWLIAPDNSGRLYWRNGGLVYE